MKLATKRIELLHMANKFIESYAYAYGAKRCTGVLTEAKLQSLVKNSPETYTADYIAKTRLNIGKHVIDCSGLVCACWGISDIGSTAISELPNTQPQNYVVVKPETNELLYGDVLWKKGHVGIYLGAGRVLEARGVTAGVIISNVNNTLWAKAIRKRNWHWYAYCNEWCEDECGYWYPYGTAMGEYYHDCICDPDGGGYYYEFDKDGYATLYNIL